MTATPRYLEDFVVGQTLETAEHRITTEEIIAFAQQYDPQPFHVSPEAATETFFGEHVASGWHTAALTMRLIATGDAVPAWGVIGRGVDDLKWPNPVRPGDRLKVILTVEDIIPSRSKPHVGTVRMRCTTVNQNGDPVQDMVANMIVPRKIAAKSEPAAS